MLVDVDNKGHQLEEKAAVAFLAMYKAAVADGVNLVINSATRDTKKQQALYAAYVARRKNWDDSGSNPASKPTPVAKPGTSEHEEPRAIAVDINVTNARALSWLMQHGPTHGFYATASGERWHWAFYGAEIPARLLERHRANLANWR